MKQIRNDNALAFLSRDARPVFFVWSSCFFLWPQKGQGYEGAIGYS